MSAAQCALLAELKAAKAAIDQPGGRARYLRAWLAVHCVEAR